MNKRRLLILGGNGMLGHKLWQLSRNSMDAFVTLRRPLPTYHYRDLFDPTHVISKIDAMQINSIAEILTQFKPAVVVNCIGIVKQRKTAKDPVLSICLNSLFPHQLKELCNTGGVRLIHLSTDCIFSGEKGNYREEDPSDAEDLYGKSKYLGEVDGKGCLTIRTSIIGRELENRLGLVEWLLSQNGKTVRGFTRAIYSGFTTITLSRIILSLIQDFPDLSGIYHISREPIDKYSLLKILVKRFRLQIDVEPADDFVCDRSLDGSRFSRATSLRFPSYPEMIEELVKDSEINKNYYEVVR